MAKFKALVTAEVIPEILSALSDKIDFVYDGYFLDHNVMPHSELIEKIPEYDVLVCEYDTIDAAVLEAAKCLKIIICCRGGVGSVIDLSAAKERGIIVCNNAGRNANAVADMIMAFILCMTRNILSTNELVHNGTILGEKSTKPSEYKDTVWGLDNDSPFIKYRGKSINYMTLGIVGFGHAGRLLAKKANAFGMKIIAADPFVKKSKVPEYVEIVDSDTLLANADIVSLNCISTPQTKNMFNKEAFAKMKEGSYFINTSRGNLVVEEDMCDALNSGHLRGAAIDVARQEPIPPTSPLVAAKNLIITPHIAGSSLDVQVTGSNMVVESLSDWVQGDEPRNCVIGR